MEETFSKTVYKELFKSSILDELDQKEANEILVRSSPPDVSCFLVSLKDLLYVIPLIVKPLKVG